MRQEVPGSGAGPLAAAAAHRVSEVIFYEEHLQELAQHARGIGPTCVSQEPGIRARDQSPGSEPGIRARANPNWGRALAKLATGTQNPPSFLNLRPNIQTSSGARLQQLVRGLAAHVHLAPPVHKRASLFGDGGVLQT